MNKVET